MQDQRAGGVEAVVVERIGGGGRGHGTLRRKALVWRPRAWWSSAEKMAKKRSCPVGGVTGRLRGRWVVPRPYREPARSSTPGYASSPADRCPAKAPDALGFSLSSQACSARILSVALIGSSGSAGRVRTYSRRSSGSDATGARWGGEMGENVVPRRAHRVGGRRDRWRHPAPRVGRRASTSRSARPPPRAGPSRRATQRRTVRLGGGRSAKRAARSQGGSMCELSLLSR